MHPMYSLMCMNRRLPVCICICILQLMLIFIRDFVLRSMELCARLHLPNLCNDYRFMGIVFVPTIQLLREAM